jgi:hypothetical protein
MLSSIKDDTLSWFIRGSFNIVDRTVNCCLSLFIIYKIHQMENSLSHVLLVFKMLCIGAILNVTLKMERNLYEICQLNYSESSFSST